MRHEAMRPGRIETRLAEGKKLFPSKERAIRARIEELRDELARWEQLLEKGRCEKKD
jgi:hypothetical protein